MPSVLDRLPAGLRLPPLAAASSPREIPPLSSRVPIPVRLFDARLEVGGGGANSDEPLVNVGVDDPGDADKLEAPLRMWKFRVTATQTKAAKIHCKKR